MIDISFHTLTEKLRLIINDPLPGLDAQLRMAPAIRPVESMEHIKSAYNPKISAVLILIYPKGDETHCLYIKRTASPGVHSGQISFPGGRQEEGDRDLVHTALREAREEIGVMEDVVEVVGNLTELYIPPSNFLVQPVLGLLDHTPEFVKQIEEVDQILELPVTHYFDDSLFGEKEVKVGGRIPIQAPYFDLLGETLWGATAMITAELIEILRKARER